MTIYCAMGKDCPYGPIVCDDYGTERYMPEEAYSQTPEHTMYRGLCLNCLDDYNQDMEMMRDCADDWEEDSLLYDLGMCFPFTPPGALP